MPDEQLHLVVHQLKKQSREQHLDYLRRLQEVERQRCELLESDKEAESTRAVNLAALEASIESCTTNYERITHMLADEPNDQKLIDFRDQLDNAIKKLKATIDLVSTRGS